MAEQATSQSGGEIGDKIRYWRERRGLQRKAFGKLLKTGKGTPVSEGQVWRWEDGRDTPQPWRRQEIADALGVSPGAIFGEPENPQLLVRLDLTERRVDAITRILGIGEAVDIAVGGQRRAKGDEGADARTAEQEAEREESGLERELDDDGLRPDSSEQPGEGSEPGSENQ